MSKVRVLVADDEPLARRGVRQLLAPHADFIVIGECRNGAETLHALDTLRPDVLFLDIQMPEMNGFEILRAHGAKPMPLVVFVTAHDQFAVRAFEAHALDYLVKPLNVARFETVIARVRERLRMMAAVEHDARLLVVSTATSDLVIPVSHIDWIGADDYYARLHVGAKSYLLRESLASLEARLASNRFLRVHRAAIVQLDRVREVQADSIVLRDGTRVPLSRRRRALLRHQTRQTGA